MRGTFEDPPAPKPRKQAVKQREVDSDGEEIENQPPPKPRKQRAKRKPQQQAPAPAATAPAAPAAPAAGRPASLAALGVPAGAMMPPGVLGPDGQLRSHLLPFLPMLTGVDPASLPLVLGHLALNISQNMQAFSSLFAAPAPAPAAVPAAGPGQVKGEDGEDGEDEAAGEVERAVRQARCWGR